MTVMDDVDAVSLDSVAASAQRANTAGTSEETVNSSLDCEDNANGIETEAVSGGRVIRKHTHPMSAAMADSVDSVRDGEESADAVGTEDSADPTDSRSMEVDDPADRVDQSLKDDINGCESDGDSTSEGTCLEAMTPCGQDYYLRLGVTPRRRSALRLSRIIARQQLLRRLAQGRNRELRLLSEFHCD